MKGVKPPYLLLCTHMAFMDFKVTTAAIFPHRANYVVAIDGFIGREMLLRMAGGICKRKFTNDIQLIRQIRHVIVKHKDILALYPKPVFFDRDERSAACFTRKNGQTGECR